MLVAVCWWLVLSMRRRYRMDGVLASISPGWEWSSALSCAVQQSHHGSPSSSSCGWCCLYGRGGGRYGCGWLLWRCLGGLFLRVCARLCLLGWLLPRPQVQCCGGDGGGDGWSAGGRVGSRGCAVFSMSLHVAMRLSRVVLFMDTSSGLWGWYGGGDGGLG